MKLLLRLLVCMSVFGLSLYFYLDKVNEQTKWKLKLPGLEKEVEEIKQNNIQLAFDLENFRSPHHLLELARQPQYSHLKFPYSEEVMVVSGEIAKQVEKNSEKVEWAQSKTSKWPIFLGSTN